MGPKASKMLPMVAAAVLILCTAEVGLAQSLDDNCTVSVLNRTVRVKADGSWVLPNVPANFGQVKARATCVRNGVTSSGESAFFTVPANGAVNLPAIVLGSATQIPASLSITPANPSFTAAGQTAQLLVTATYPDNSTRDVTQSSTGTNYTTSNSAIATVNANGLVTAVASGTVVIQATNDGATGIITAAVTLSNTDSDGDGIPDDVEISLGLDPHNPVDAQEDFDRDGLTNLREFQLGTGLRVFDTDGDGIGDGLEVQTGSNPLDPNSFNLAQALQSIQATPTNIVLLVNTIIGEASQQLTVTGRLIDGNLINLTSRSRATNYSSSDLAVANFGAVDGLVFAGSDGSATITVSNNGFTAPAVQVNVSSFAPTALSFVTIPGFANNVDVSGNFAYVAAGAAGLQVVDVTDRRSPHIVGSLDTPGNANDVRVVGNRAYVADGSAGLQIIDITNPNNPTLLGTLDTPGEANDVVVVGNRAYVADGPTGLKIIDVSNPQAPALLGTFDTPGIARGVDVSGNIAVIADGSSVRTVAVGNPASPTALGSVSTTDARDLTVDGTIAYVADFTGSLRVIDFSTPGAPQLLATTPQSLGGILMDVAKARDFVFGADVFFVNGVPIINVGTPANPSVRARLDFPARDDNGTGIAVDNVFVYLTADQSLQENGVSGNSRLYIGQYVSLDDTAGIPPVVSITSPVAGATVIEGMTISITVQATDDVQVASVDFLVNGAVVFTDSASPYEFMLTVPTGVTGLTLGARAVDLGSNVGIASDVQINVTPDPRTTVAGRVVDVNNNPIAGATASVFNLSSVTGGDGSFSIPSVPTVRGNIQVVAVATVNNVPVTGVSGAFPPVSGGVTDVGTIIALENMFDPNIGELVATCDDCFVQRTLPFTFGFYGQPHTTVFVNNNGNLSFDFGDGDYTESVAEFNGQPRISAFWDDLISEGDIPATGLYVNDQIPGKFIVTWFRQQEYCCVGDSTIQATLFLDGRILYSYNGVTSLDAIVGVTPGGAAPIQQVDFSATPMVSVDATTAVLEQFTTPVPFGTTDPPGSGQGPDHPFDMDSHSLIMIPNAAGGYDISFHTPTPTATGNVEGTVYDASGNFVAAVEVTVLSSGNPAFSFRVTTDASGHYRVTGVPLGGINAIRVANNTLLSRGAGRLQAPGQTITLDLRPLTSPGKQ